MVLLMTSQYKQITSAPEKVQLSGQVCTFRTFPRGVAKYSLAPEVSSQFLELRPWQEGTKLVSFYEVISTVRN